MSLDTAIRHLQFAIASNDLMSEAHFQLAKIYNENSDINAAISESESAISAGLELIQVFEKKGNFLLKKRQFPEAKQQLIKANVLKNECSIYHVFLCSIYWSKQDIEKCTDHAWAALDLLPQNADAFLYLSYLDAKAKKWKSSVENAEKSIEINFYNAHAHLHMAIIKHAQKKGKDATHHYLIARDLDKNIIHDKLQKLSEKYPDV